jgi:YihY family inner membrane protein
MNNMSGKIKKFCKRVKLIYSNFLSDQCFLRASSLAYITFLGFIPFLMVILLFTPDITVVKIRDAIIGFVFQAFMPKAAETMKPFFNQLLERRVGLNVIGFILLLVTSFFLFKSISTTFDKILGVPDKKGGSIWRDFERFVAAIIGGLVVVAALLFATSLPMIGKVFKLALLIKILPYLGIFLLLSAMYKYVTSIHPKTTYAFVGAAFTSVVWVLLKMGFDWYIATFTNVRSVYGTVGAFPVFMIWLYANWVIILFGVEIVSFYSGNRLIRKEEEEGGKITLKLTVEQNINKKHSKKLEELKLSELKVDAESFLRKIKEMISTNLSPSNPQHISDKSDAGEQRNDKEVNNELQKK